MPRARVRKERPGGRGAREGPAKGARLRLLERIVHESPSAIAILRGREYRYELVNPAYQTFDPHRALLGRPYRECWPEAADQILPAMDRVMAGAGAFRAHDVRLELRRGPEGAAEVVYFQYTLQRLEPDASGEAGLLVTAMETTDTVLARLRAQAGEERLRRVLEASADGHWELDFVTGRMYRSAPRDGFLGRASFAEEVDAAGWRARAHPDDVGRIGQELDAWIAGRLERLDIEARAPREGGAWSWIRLRGKVVERDAAGRPVRGAGIVSDIHDRKLAEEALREREAQLALIVGNSHEGISLLDLRTGRYVLLSPSQVAMTGFSEAELRVLTAHDVLARCHPDDQYIWAEQQAAIAAGREVLGTAEYRWRVKSGEYRWFSDSRRVVRDAAGGAVAIVGVSRDVTDRKAVEAALRRSEEQLQRSEARFRELAELAPVGIFLAGADGRIAFANAEAVRILGLPAEGLSGEGWMAALHPDDRERVAGEWAAAARAERVVEAEHRFLHRDGRVVLARGYGSAVRGPDREVTGVIGVVVDVTESQRLREQVAVSARLATVGTLLAGVAHEVNNPLGIAIASDVFAMDALAALRTAVRSGEALDPAQLERELAEVHAALEDARAGDERVAGIVRDLWAFAKPRLERTRIPLQAIVERAMRWLPALVADRADLAVEHDGAAEVFASEGQMSQALVNLVTNAAKSAPLDRRVAVSIRTGRARPGMAFLAVTDDGAGMTPEVLGRVFDPFYSTRKPGEGMGLGLSIVHAIVTASGGTIHAASTPGAGTTFRIELPVAAPEA